MTEKNWSQLSNTEKKEKVSKMPFVKYAPAGENIEELINATIHKYNKIWEVN